MSTKNTTITIDIGTEKTKVVIAEQNSISQNKPLSIVGIGSGKTKGMHYGYITEPEKVAENLIQIKKEVEKNYGIKINKAIFSVGGISLESKISQGSIIISKESPTITSTDIERVIQDAEDQIDFSNRKILFVNPVSFKIDGKKVLGQPEGMSGIKLEAKILFISILEQHFDSIFTVAEYAKIDVVDIIPNPLASGSVSLTEKQRVLGCILIDIGSETVTSTVFEEGSIVSVDVSSIGSSAITSDIALGLQVSPEEAESIKLGGIIGDYPKKKIEEIIEARLSDIFERIEKQLKKINRSGLLPAGAIITGGGANISNIEDFAKKHLKLPAQVSKIEEDKSRNKFKDSSWSVAFGLQLYKNRNKFEKQPSLFQGLKQLKSFLKSIGKQMLP